MAARANRKPVALSQDKPRLRLPDPREAAQEVARLAQEGNRKFCLAVDALRGALETIVIAEMDHHTGRPVTAQDLRAIALGGLDSYSALTGQNWRKAKIIGDRSGDRSINSDYNAGEG